MINCGKKFIPSVKLSIETNCQGSQCANITSYKWTLYEDDPPDPNSPITRQRRNNLQSIIRTPLDSRRIVIKESSIVGGKNYSLLVFARTADGISGISAYNFSSALPPLGGTCTIKPSSGITLKTYFNLSCTNWTNTPAPLSYQFRYQLYNGLTSMVYHSFNTSVTSLLPSGDSADNYTLNFTVTVTDRKGASAPVVNLSVQVGFNLVTKM